MTIVRAAAWAMFVPMLFALGACSTSKGVRAPADDTTVGRTGTGQAGGGYYLDDGPGQLSPADVAAIPDAVPRAEPVLARTARPYTVFGRTYTPMNALVPYRERGVASWYGRRYHGKPTSSGEPYDMYAMTAAHPTLAIPSFVRVTRVATGRSVVVRVNDRGPFLQNRLIDLSYTAAAKLGFVEMGSAEVEVETITQFDGPGAPPVQVANAVMPSGNMTAGPGPAPGPDVAVAPASAVAASAVASTTPDTGAPTIESASEAPPPQRLVVETQFTGEHAANPSLAALAEPTATSSLPTQPPSEKDAPGFWLQFGAFASADGARAASDRFRRELAWLGARFDVRQEGALYKVQAGPWPEREHALDAAARVRRATTLQPFAIFR